MKLPHFLKHYKQKFERKTFFLTLLKNHQLFSENWFIIDVWQGPKYSSILERLEAIHLVRSQNFPKN